MTDEPRLRVAAPAKVNLYLRVTGRRSDGYHLLDSLVAFAGIHDTLLLEPADDLTLTVEGPFARSLAADDPAGNLVMRAARSLAAAAGVAPRARIILIKRLPVASGIGGGSADAAAALRGLAKLWAVRPAPEDLDRLALALGADVPACLGGRSAFLSGIGETLRPAPTLARAGILLVNPGAPVSTPEVFGRRRRGFSPPAAAEGLAEAVDAEALARLLGPLGNDLAAPAIEIAPVIANVLDALRGTSGCRLARLSGSGATCFGLFDDRTAAERAAVEVAPARPDWWVAPTVLVNDISEIEPSA